MKLSKVVKKLRYRILIVVVAVSILIACGLFFLHKWDVRRGEFPEHEFENNTIVYEGQTYTLNRNIETFLLIGLDKFDLPESEDSYNNDNLADFLVLFVIDNGAQTCTAIHINRDTMAEVAVLGVAGNPIYTVNQQIAFSYTYGNGRDVSCHNTAEAVSMTLKGIKVNHYASITMDAVGILNDLIGGVEVEILDDFTNIDSTWVKGETVTLLGENALAYVRTRKGLEDSSNANRMKRQQQYIQAFRDTVETRLEENSNLIVEGSLKVSDQIVSDRSIGQLQNLVEKIERYEFLGILELEGESKRGSEYVEFYPDEDAVAKLVVDLFYHLKK